MRQLYFSTLFGCITFFTFGQQQKIDSLKIALSREANSLQKLETLDVLTSKLKNNNLDEYLSYVDTMYVIAKKINNKSYIANSLNRKGIYYSTIFNKDKSLEFFNKSLKYYEEINNKKKVSDIIGNIGQVYQDAEVIDSANFYLNKSINLSIKIKNYSRLFYNYYSLGVYESRMDNNIKAVEYILKALTNAEKSKNKANIAYANSLLGIIYVEQEFYDKAEEKFKKSLSVFKKLDNFHGLAGQYGNLASLYSTRDLNYKKSNLFYKKAVSNYKKVSSYESICISEFNIGKNFLNLNELDSARFHLNKSFNLGKINNFEYGISGVLSYLAEVEFKSKNYKKAEKFLKQSLKDLQGDDFIYEKSNSLILASQIYSKQYRFKEAYNSYVQGNEIQDSLLSIERTSKILDIESKYQNEKKEKENLQLKADNVKQELLTQKANTRNWILLISLLTLGISAIFIWRRYKSEAKAKQIISEQKYLVETLQKELHHRMKNNLSFIDLFINLAKSRFPDEAYQTKLNELQNRMRSMFEVHKQLFKKDDVTSVKAKSYIDTLIENVQKAYEKNNITIANKTDTKETILADTSFPMGLIVNEFVTNSYKHAFNDKENGVIDINLTSNNTHYKLSLKDNGKGFPLDFNIDDLDSFGLETIQLLTKEYGGTFKIDGANGVTMNITLPKTAA